MCVCVLNIFKIVSKLFDDRWYEFDDIKVDTITTRELITSGEYVLLRKAPSKT